LAQNIGDLFAPARRAGATVDLPLTDSVALTLTWCPAGRFDMGSVEGDGPPTGASEKKYEVTLTRGFWLGQTAVTQSVWEAVTGGTFRATGGPESASRPVEATSWETSVKFCESCTALLKRRGVLQPSQAITLPTEAQWEYACRAGTHTLWYFGNDAAELEKHAWYRANSGDRSHPVGSKLPNPWGFYDLYGNVAEWCLDNFYMYPDSPAVDPCYIVEDSSSKIVRGGAYTHLADECTSVSRGVLLTYNPFTEESGLRLACVET
jgi:formylglycine-generating enzyme required for sulfatase activity